MVFYLEGRLTILAFNYYKNDRLYFIVLEVLFALVTRTLRKFDISR